MDLHCRDIILVLRILIDIKQVIWIIIVRFIISEIKIKCEPSFILLSIALTFMFPDVWNVNIHWLEVKWQKNEVSMREWENALQSKSP